MFVQVGLRVYLLSYLVEMTPNYSALGESQHTIEWTLVSQKFD